MFIGRTLINKLERCGIDPFDCFAVGNLKVGKMVALTGKLKKKTGKNNNKYKGKK